MNAIIEKVTWGYGLYVRAARMTGPVTLLLMRVFVGSAFFFTGRGKLLNLEWTAGFFESLNIPAPKFNAMMAGGTEMVGGILLAIGLGSRVISLPLAGTMVVALATAHRSEVTKAIGEFDPGTVLEQAPIVYLVTVLVVLAFGPGVLSLDGLIGKLLGKKRADEPKLAAAGAV